MIPLILIYLIFTSTTVVQAGRILAVFPTASISHQVVFRPLVHELVKRGHEVVLITPDPAFPNGGAPANLTEIDIHDVSYKIVEDFMAQNMVKLTTEKDLFTMALMFTNYVTESVEAQLKSDNVQKFLMDKTQKFDLIFIEAFVRPALVFSHLYKAPVILVSSFGPVIENLEAVGAASHPILYPITFSRRINDLSLSEKLREIIKHFFYKRIVNTFQEIENSMLRRVFGKDIPTPSDLVDNVEMLFLNVHPIWDSNRPVPPNVVYMGGLHQKPEKELPQDLKKFLDSSKNGVIYMSFGTNVHPGMFSPSTVQLFLNVLSSLPYNVLWKWSEEFPKLPKNVKVAKWLPQSDLLRHPNVKLFITQGGLQSTDESITAGVPLVGIPMLGDQWYNVEMYERHQIGIRLDAPNITEQNFRNAILTVIENDSYRKNIVKVRDILNDQPQTALERAVWWTEYVLRHGGARHLRTAAANMPLMQYYEIELVTYLLLGLVAILVVSVLLLKLIFTLIKSLLSSKTKVKTN